MYTMRLEEGAVGVVAEMRLLDVRQLAETLNMHPRSIWRLTAMAEAGQGNFPKPLRIGPKTVRWRLADVRAYLAALAGERRLVTDAAACLYSLAALFLPGFFLGGVWPAVAKAVTGDGPPERAGFGLRRDLLQHAGRGLALARNPAQGFRQQEPFRGLELHILRTEDLPHVSSVFPCAEQQAASAADGLLRLFERRQDLR